MTMAILCRGRLRNPTVCFFIIALYSLCEGAYSLKSWDLEYLSASQTIPNLKCWLNHVLKLSGYFDPYEALLKTPTFETSCLFFWLN